MNSAHLFALFFGVILATFLKPAVSRSEIWPANHIYGTHTVFGLNRTLGFVDIFGMNGPVEEVEDESSYHFFVPEPAWKSKLECHAESRGQGYIQTDSDRLVGIRQIKVGIPVKFSIHTRFTESRKQQVLAIPLLKATILVNNGGSTKALNGHTDVYRLEDLYRGSNEALVNPTVVTDPNVPLSFTFNSIVTGAAQTLPSGAKFRIRVEWSAEGICGEEPFLPGQPSLELGIGDQFRILSGL